MAMPANPPTKAPEAPAAPVAAKPPAGKDEKVEKFDRFRPEMPQIPGVSDARRPSQGLFGSFDSQQVLQIGGVAGVLLLIVVVAFLWRARNKSQAAAKPAADVEVAEQPEPALIVPDAVPRIHEGPSVAATVEELAKPWAARKFTFVNPLTQESVAAMVVRLPSGGLWAFSLQAPFGRCQLEFVADLDAIAAKYRYTASHPMVVDPCDSTVYDPLKVGPLGGNTWARGEIVKGNSLRPPISIDVKVRGRSIIADSIE